MNLSIPYLYQKVGILDSGFGSLSVLDAFLKHKIARQYVLYADNKHAPWGNKSKEQLWPLIKQALDYLNDQEIDALVLGCNTTDSLFFKEVAACMSIPVYGLLECASKQAAKATRLSRVMVLATQQTIASGRYKTILLEEKSDLFVAQLPILDWVPAIESGIFDEAFLDSFQSVVKTIKDNRVDVCILGCTHFPLLRDSLEKALGKSVWCCDPAMALSLELKTASEQTLTDSVPIIECFSTGSIKKVEQLAKKYMPHLTIKMMAPTVRV